MQISSIAVPRKYFPSQAGARVVYAKVVKPHGRNIERPEDVLAVKAHHRVVNSPSVDMEVVFLGDCTAWRKPFSDKTNKRILDFRARQPFLTILMGVPCSQSDHSL